MPQTTLTVVLEVNPPSEGVLRDRIEAIRNKKVRARDRLLESVPALHFMSLTVFKDDLYDSVLVLEANFDGPPGPFWAQLEATLGTELRDMLRCCRPPRDKATELFNVVVGPQSRAPIAPLLEACTIMPAAWHQGNRGLERNRILAEGRLFALAQEELNAGVGKGATSASQIHELLRERLLERLGWLGPTPPRRIGTREHLTDLWRLWGIPVALGLLMLLLLPVMALPGLHYARAHALRPVPTVLLTAGSAALGLLLVLLILAAIVVPFVRAFLRDEIRDAAQDVPVLDADKLRAMAALEDSIAQNHMISLVHLKPGIVRAIVARLTLLVLGLLVRSKKGEQAGYLQSMRTIHFAHWALVSNGARLMFHSNFDGSWESYLDDFIEKAHQGLTAAWTHGVGFPRTRRLTENGASSGSKFKAWARHSMNVSQFWYSAYPYYSVNQIERHARVADGLRRATLTDQEATKWALDL